MSSIEMTPIPYGVAVDPTNVAFVLVAGGEIAHIDLATGQVLARSDFAGVPLVATKKAMFGWSWNPSSPGVLRLFAACVEGDALRVRWSHQALLPEWVSIESSHTRRFSVHAELDGETVVFVWEAHARYEGGAPPPQEVEMAAVHDERRIVRLAAESGGLIEEESVDATPLAEAQTVDPTTERLVPYRRNRGWVNDAWHYGDANALMISRPVSGSGLVLRRASASVGDDEAEVVRLSDRAAADVVVSGDGSTVFVHEPSSKHYRAFDVVEGNLVARLPWEAGTDDAAVVGDRVVYSVVEDSAGLRRRFLRARDLTTGQTVFTHLVSEEAIRPAPPPPP